MRPLLLIFLACAALVLVRLYQIQIQESGLWAEEALGLIHSGHEIPYSRGRILDTHGSVLARDKVTNHVVLLYRDFRRGHSLGQIAHARSLLEGRAVSLVEARAQLQPWALQLLQMTPRDLEELGRQPGHARRAKDIGFYARRLLALDKRQLRRLEKWAREEGRDRSFIELASGVLRRDNPGEFSTPEAVWDAVRTRMEREDRRLVRLAGLLEWSPTEVLVSSQPIDRLVLEIERVRRWVEDATAAKLFFEATGFVPGRIAADTLVSTIDLSWISRLLAWDAERLDEWARTTRSGWVQNWRDGYALPRLMLQLRLEPARTPGPDDVLSRVATLFQDPASVTRALNQEVTDWREIEELVVLDGLGDLFGGGNRRGALSEAGSVLPFQSDALRAAFPGKSQDWALLDAVWDREAGLRTALDSTPELAVVESEAPGTSIQQYLTSSAYDAGLHLVEAVARLAENWDAGYQAELSRRLAELQSATAPRDLSADGLLVLAEEHRDRAAERAEYFLKDYGRRTRSLIRGEPSYEVIYLLTRYEQDFPGFYAREAREREYPVLPGDEVRPAASIIGGVSSVTVRDLLAQRTDARQMDLLKANPDKTDVERLELRSLVGSVLLHDEVKGIVGVEGFWNRDLVGRNGYREVRGLESISDRARRDTLVRGAEDGLDVTLTMDMDLQRAARRTMMNPSFGDEDDYDRNWYRNPVGAALLLSIDGDILAAVSEPNASSEIGDNPGEQRASRIERTFRAPTFQPPGSVVKPLIAAYALSARGFDPEHIVNCSAIEKGGAGYVDVNCHNLMGHGEISLHEALVHSCNAYFAYLGEWLGDADLRKAVGTFGLDERTGVRRTPPWEVGLRRRIGFAEDAGGLTSHERLGGSLSQHQCRLAGNGLAEMTATPMQLGRAALALATGQLTDLRLVRRIGERDLPPGETSALAITPEALATVRAALVDVVGRGSAHRALAPGVLGLDVAAKTGSADLVRGRGKEVRKHTWVMGWLPVEDPEMVFVVFVHDTRKTSSHGAIHIARQLLLQPEVLNWLYEHDVDVSRVVLK